ncbi:MAG: hypothetical protein DWP92_07580 [Armatimonadetes bacterium]|nr:MAG: hypothetical protein DWP92_07580 [Armatimonadota bacterium]
MAVAVLVVGCGPASGPPSFDFDDVALFGGLDTRAVVLEQEEGDSRCMAAEGFEFDLACVAPHSTELSDIAAQFERPLTGDTESYLTYLSELAEVYGTR